jgi:1,4-alpha-glucan branching enzyme
VHGKGSLIQRMPGNEWQKFANLRAMMSCMFTHPGSKLLFMGSEIAQYKEWNYKESLDWDLLKYEYHLGIQNLVKQLNQLYKSEPALFEKAFSPDGFEWIDFGDNQNSTISYMRKGNKTENDLIVIANLTPVTRENYRIGLPSSSNWNVIFNSDGSAFGGAGLDIPSTVKPDTTEKHYRKYSGAFTLPPLSVLVLKSEKKKVSKASK